MSAATQQPATQPVGTPAEQTIHREPAPSPAQHNTQFRQTRPDDVIGR